MICNGYLWLPIEWEQLLVLVLGKHISYEGLFTVSFCSLVCTFLKYYLIFLVPFLSFPQKNTVHQLSCFNVTVVKAAHQWCCVYFLCTVFVMYPLVSSGFHLFPYPCSVSLPCSRTKLLQVNKAIISCNICTQALFTTSSSSLVQVKGTGNRKQMHQLQRLFIEHDHSTSGVLFWQQ